MFGEHQNRTNIAVYEMMIINLEYRRHMRFFISELIRSYQY